MLPVLTLLLAPPLQNPMTEFLAAYPRGEQLTCAISPDGKRCFVADGASIAVLDTTALIPDLYPTKSFAWIDVVDATAHQMLLFEDSLFIAGGTGGLFRVQLGPGYFTDPPGTLSHTVGVLDSPFLFSGKAGDPNTYRWKRCVDVAVVEQPGRKLVFGLFAASPRHLQTGDPQILGATELVAWELPISGAAAYYGRFVFDSTVVVPIGAQNDIKGTALAADPGDPSSLYVGLGIRWVWRVDISSVAGVSDPRFPSANELFNAASPPIAPCSGAPCPEGERVRDLAIVRRNVTGGTQALAYAAFEYGRLVEFELPMPGQPQASVLTVYQQGCNHGERVSAMVDPSNNVFVAFGSQTASATGADTAAPFRPTGVWGNPCVGSGIPEPNPPPATPNPCVENGIRLLLRKPNSGLSPMGLSGLPGVVGDSGILTRTYWGGLAVRSGGLNRYLVYESTVSGGFDIHELSLDPFPAGPSAPMAGPTGQLWFVRTLSHYQGPTSGHSDGTVSASDDTFVYFGGEPFGEHPPQGSVMRVVPPSPPNGWMLVPIAQTHSVCPSGAAPLTRQECDDVVYPSVMPEPFEADVLGDPQPFLGGILGSACWVDPWEGASPDDPLHPVRDWFVGGGPTWRQGGCLPVPGIDTCSFTNTCGSSPIWRKSWLPSFDGLYDPMHPEILRDQSRVGFKYVLLDPLLSNGAQMDMRWWQVVAPTANADDRATSVDLLYAEVDPRTEVVGANGAFVPRMINGVRGASRLGYKPMSTRGYMKKALRVCQTANPDDRGRGQELDGVPLPGGAPLFYEAATHIEFEDLPLPYEPCRVVFESGFCPAPPGGFRAAFNNKLHTFRLETQSFGTRYVTAIAAGFVASGAVPGVQSADCQWGAEFGKLLVTFYDVTNTPGGANGLNPAGAPQLLRVALGPKGGHAFAVRAKEYANGKTLVFVADLLGNIHVIDVSGDTLFPAASTPYRPVGCLPSQCTPVLFTDPSPSANLAFAKDLVDGQLPNCVDIEIDGDVLYCALARAGVALVDISRPLGAPLNLQTLAILETPGLAQGVAFRGNGAGRQMLVGDSRAGMRLYGRAQ